MLFTRPARASLSVPSRGRPSRQAQPRLCLEQLEDRVVPSILIPVTNHRDLVYDPYRSALDITTSTGAVQPYSVMYQYLMPPVYIGGNLAGADITADGNTLVVAEQKTPTNQGVLHRLNLNYMAPNDLYYPLFPGEGGAYDLALGPGSTGFVDDTSLGSSPVPLHQFDVNTGFTTTRPDIPGSYGYGQIGGSSQIHRSADRSLLLITDAGNPSYGGSLITYSPQTDTFSWPYPMPYSLANAMTAVNRNGTLIAVQVNGSTTILRQNGQNGRNWSPVMTLQGIDGGVAFDPGQDLLYGVVSTQGQILAFDTNTWQVKYGMPTEEAVPKATPLGNGVMTVSTDGAWLFLATPSGVREYRLPWAPGPAVTLAIVGIPPTATAGAPTSFTVTALDPTGRVVSGYMGTVHFATSDPQAVLPADYTFTPTDLGSHKFTVTFKTAATQTLKAYDTHNSILYGVSPPIQVQPGPLASFLVQASPSNPQAAGYSFSVILTARDAYNNVATNYTGKVHFSSTDATAQLPSDYTFTANDKGKHAFSVTLNKAGSQTVFINDTLNPAIKASVLVTVANYIPGLYFTLSPTTTTPTAGTPFGLTVTAWDVYNHVATHYVGTITFTTSDRGTGVVLPANYTFTAADAGVHTFTNGVILVSAGSQSVTIRDTAYSTGATGGGATGSGTGAPITSRTVTVSPAAANSLQVTGFPASVTAGSGGTFTVTAYDAYGNVATGYSGTVHFSSSDGQASLLADASLTNGTGTFSATLATAGTQSLTAIDTASGSISGTQAGITVGPSAASTFQVAGFPLSVTAGNSGGMFTVTAYDAYGNVATGYGGTVHFSSSDGQASLPVDASLTNGTGTFSPTLKTAGSQALTATDTANAALTATEAGITVNPAAASVLVLNAPSTVTAGVPFTFTITLEDAYGNVATGYLGTVHFSSSDPLAGLPNDYAFTTADAGVQTFTATLGTSGSQSLTATDDANGLSSTLNLLVA